MTQTQTQPVVNKFGRKGGRGIRPWLLLPKVIAFCVYLGGLTTVLVLWVASDFKSLDLGDPRRKLILDQVSRLMVFLVVPALLVTIILGVSLMMQYPKQFLRTRWLRVKLISLAIIVPASHFYCETRFVRLRTVADDATSDGLATQLTIGFVAALIGSAWVVILGRLKPRLGKSPVPTTGPATYVA
jgi:uncharacterized membrane protein